MFSFPAASCWCNWRGKILNPHPLVQNSISKSRDHFNKMLEINEARLNQYYWPETLILQARGSLSSDCQASQARSCSRSNIGSCDFLARGPADLLKYMYIPGRALTTNKLVMRMEVSLFVEQTSRWRVHHQFRELSIGKYALSLWILPG